MNIDSEIAELKRSFKEGNILTKIIMLLGFFLTLSSLTNLSGEIIKWKGFILDGISFYRFVFVEPVSHISKFVGLGYSEVEIHVATISSICIAIGMRVQINAQKVAFQNISKKYGNEINPDLTFLWMLGVFTPIGIWLWYGLSDPEIHIWWVTFTSIFLPLFMVVPKVIMSKFSEHAYYERGQFSYFKAYYIYIASLVLAICVLAAINGGLSNIEDGSNKTIQPTANASAD